MQILLAAFQLRDSRIQTIPNIPVKVSIMSTLNFQIWHSNPSRPVFVARKVFCIMEWTTKSTVIYSGNGGNANLSRNSLFRRLLRYNNLFTGAGSIILWNEFQTLEAETGTKLKTCTCGAVALLNLLIPI